MLNRPRLPSKRGKKVLIYSHLQNENIETKHNKYLKESWMTELINVWLLSKKKLPFLSYSATTFYNQLFHVSYHILPFSHRKLPTRKCWFAYASKWLLLLVPTDDNSMIKLKSLICNRDFACECWLGTCKTKRIIYF